MATTEAFEAPLGYGIVERDLYRSHLGTDTSIESLNSCKSMLRKLGLRTVINMGPDPLQSSDPFGNFCEREGVHIYNPCLEDASGGLSFDLGEEAIKAALKKVLDGQMYPLMVVGTPDRHLASRLLGCLRRIQGWAISAIVAEYRMFTGRPHVYDVNEQFIERFDIEVVSIDLSIAPSWLVRHFNMLNEERVNNCNDVDVRLVSESCQYNRKTWLLDAEED
eukprot:235200_1